ncbi:MAG: anaerobic ribonucleoside-triphosphate reductase activating protein [Candidatus Bipolaricaulis sp.]|nr:anaerobic ribonucleoside-triphosphate reductase activating protein [Candidatus Bipolaricaulis sp.]
MEIGGFQKFSLIDYPNHLSAVVFTRGCNMHCGYCHNPELIDHHYFSKKLNNSRILSFLEKRKDQLDGLVVTGGEPTIQADILDFLKKVKTMGYEIKLDTNGSRPDVLERLIASEAVDYFAMDIKAPDFLYSQITGVDIDINLIKKSIDIIRNSGQLYEFRTTIVASQLTQEDIMEIGRMIKGTDRYILQSFIAPKKLLDKNFFDQKGYDRAELEKWARSLEKNYVKYCTVR